MVFGEAWSGENALTSVILSSISLLGGPEKAPQFFKTIFHAFVGFLMTLSAERR